MTAAVESTPKEVRVTVNLEVLLGKLQISLQRLIDFVAIGLAGARRVEKSDYEEPKEFASLQVAAENRLPFATARDEFITWCLKNSFTDAVDLVSSFLEESRMVGALYSLGGRCSGADWKRAMNSEKKQFHELGFPAKIKFLREKYAISSNFENHVLSLNRARNCLVHRLGVVSEKDVDATGYLTLTWHSVNLLLIDNSTREETRLTKPTRVESESTLAARIGPHRRQLKVGDRILFDQDEHKHTMLTFYTFALQIVQAIEKLQPR
jgi:hypothetical protein